MSAVLTGPEKAAVLLVTLGSDLSADIMKELHESERDVERLAVEISRLQSVAPEVREQVLREAAEATLAPKDAKGGYKYALALLSQSLGEEKAQSIIDRVLRGERDDPFSTLLRTDPAQLAETIRGEHPQTIALVLSHFPADHAANILQNFDRQLQVEVARRIATMDLTSPEIVAHVGQMLSKRISAFVGQGFATTGGAGHLVKLLLKVDLNTQRNILDTLARSAPDLADQIRNMMFVFEDITRLDDRSIQRILAEVDTKDLATALRGSGQQVRDRFFTCMSARTVVILKEEIETSPPIRMRLIQEAQQRILSVVRRLEEAGEVTISKDGQEDRLV